MNARDDLQLLDVRDVAALLKIAPRSVWRFSALAEAGIGAFPKPVRLAPKTVRWRASDLDAYVSALAGEGPR